MSTIIESLGAEVEHIANNRFLDVIDRLIEKKVDCRRVIALRAYVFSKILIQRRKRCFDVGNLRKLSLFELKEESKSKRSDYYNTSCDCGECKVN